MKPRLLITALLLPLTLFSQRRVKPPEAGTLSLGLRSTVSAFNHHDKEGAGLGYGGQLRLQFSDRVNSEWFADYINSNIHNIASRQDAHIGWSVMYYLIDTKQFHRPVTPYILAGHCFDYTRLTDNKQILDSKDRWSAAVQAGAGTHFNISPKFDISLTMQYMIHIGNSLEAHIEDGVNDPATSDAVAYHPDGLVFEEHKHGGIEGHLLFNISLNYKIADLW